MYESEGQNSGNISVKVKEAKKSLYTYHEKQNISFLPSFPVE